MAFERPRRIRDRTKSKVHSCMEQIYAEYEQLLDTPNWERNKPTIAANVFHELLSEKYSYATIMKAKKALGIYSERIRGSFEWHLPKRSPSSIGVKMLKQKKELMARKDTIKKQVEEDQKWIKGAYHDAMLELTQLMTSTFSCEARATDAYDAMRTMFSHKITFEAKRHLRIHSVRVNGEWYWVYACKEALDHLKRRLFSRVPLEKLQQEFAQRGWSLNVLHVTRQVLGGIKQTVVRAEDGKLKTYWYDNINPKDDLVKGENTYTP